MRILFTALLLMLFTISQAQTTQTIRGTVTDKGDQMSMIGVTISIEGSNPIVGTITDLNGEFKFPDMPLGSYTLNFSMIGYKPTQLRDLMLKAGKQLFVSVTMEQQAIEMEDVVVTAFRKGEVLNNFASISARSFSVDETERFAGTWGDPSRMARNFAGVSAAGDSRNDIIIRGNSPMGLLWRIEGVDVPNPNHFAATGTSGGPVSILNNNTLQSSDFMLSAFPAEFGDATSGVFDLRMRNGNNDKYEFTGQIGFSGFELMAEGPFSKNYDGSFLVSYRYSVLSLMNKLGFMVAGGGVPEYQDLTLKLNLPTKKWGNFSIFGIGGISDISFLAEVVGDGADDYGVEKDQDLRNGSDLGIIGVSHKYILDDKSYIQTGAAYSESMLYTQIDSVKAATDNIPKQTVPFFGSDNRDNRLNISTKYTRKINRKNSINFGVSFQNQTITYRDSANVEYTYIDPATGLNNDDKGFIMLTDISGEELNTLKTYAQCHHNFTNQLEMNLGVYYHQFFHNNNYSVEPRFGLSYNLTDRDNIAFGYGMHSKIPPAINYFVNNYDDNLIENPTIKNQDLDFIKSHHFVVGYDKMFTKNLHFKMEAYYQYLYNVPVEREPSYYSLLNAGANFAADLRSDLVNEGTGENYGIDLTIEKYLTKNWYMMLTGSLFDSKYTASDNVERHTRFSTNFTTSSLGGYVYQITDKLSIDANATITFSGGLRNVPINLAESINEGEEVYDEYNAYSKREPNYFRADLRIALRQNGNKFSQEWGFDFTNITNRDNVFSQRFDAKANSIKTTYQGKFAFMLLYRINF